MELRLETNSNSKLLFKLGIFCSGQFAEKGQVVCQEFLEKTEGFAIHAPCVPSDKEIVEITD